jgi:hypothetical protein
MAYVKFLSSLGVVDHLDAADREVFLSTRFCVFGPSSRSGLDGNTYETFCVMIPQLGTMTLACRYRAVAVAKKVLRNIDSSFVINIFVDGNEGQGLPILVKLVQRADTSEFWHFRGVGFTLSDFLAGKRTARSSWNWKRDGF